MIKISVIIPVYNVERYLQKCMESVLKQSLKEIEIICVDDGSTDASGEICDKYAKIDSRIKVIHKANGGLVSARKEGLKLARGEYIGYVDSDDWIDSDMYEKLYEKAYYSNADVVCSEIECVKENYSYIEKDDLSPGIYYRSDKRICKFLYDIDKNKRKIGWNLVSKIYRRREFIPFQMNVDDDIVIGEDLVCTYPFLVNASKVCITDYVFYHYRTRENSLMRTKRYEYINDVSKIFLSLRKSFMVHEEAEVLLKQLDYIVFDLLVVKSCFYLHTSINKIYMFPYGKIKRDSKIILYGAGKVGASYYKQIQEAQYCNIVLWVDKNYSDIEFSNKNIESMDKIREAFFDYILIAIKNQNVAEIAKKEIEKKFPESIGKIMLHNPKTACWL